MSDTGVINCRNCGVELRAGARFCKNCGNPVTLEDQSSKQGFSQSTPPFSPISPAPAAGQYQTPVQLSVGAGFSFAPRYIGPALLGFGGLLMLIGVFSPWAQNVLGVSGNGFSGGIGGPLALVVSLVFIGLAVAAALGQKSKGIYMTVLILSIILTLLFTGVIIYGYSELSKSSQEWYSVPSSMGPGLFLIVIGCIACIVGSIIGLRRRNVL